MNKKRFWFCMLIIFISVFNVVYAASKENSVLNILDPVAKGEGIQTGAFADAVSKKFNVKINIVKERGEKSLSDFDIIIWENAGPDYSKACLQNELLDWEQNKLLEKRGPLLKKNFKQALLKNKFYDSPDKRMHGFCQGVGKKDEVNPPLYTWNIRKDVYEAIEKPEIDSLYDMVDIFKKMKETMPFDSEGGENFAAAIFNSDEGNMAVYATELVKAYYGYDEFDFGFYDSDTGSFYDCLSTDGPYLYCLKFLNKCQQSQLLSKCENIHKNVFWNIFANQNDGIEMISVYPKQAHPAVYCQNGYGTGEIWSISANSAQKELCMSLINWFLTENGYEALCDESCMLGVLTWLECENIHKSDSKNEYSQFKKIYTSLYVKGNGPKDVSKSAELSKLIREQSWTAIFAENDEAYETIISKMTEDAKALDYAKWVEYSGEQAKKRFAAENLLK